MKNIKFAILFILIVYIPSYASNEVSILKEGSKTCITSNGTPNHEIGKFPNKENPNSFKAQKLKFGSLTEINKGIDFIFDGKDINPIK